MLKNELQQIVGKLQFAASCVRAGRILVNRLYDCIAKMWDGIRYTITDEVRMDLKWWKVHMQDYNGISMMLLNQRMDQPEFFATDSCLQGARGICGDKYFYVTFPQYIFGWAKKVHMAHLELLAVVLGVKVWKT